jgi:hypothetical protein
MVGLGGIWTLEMIFQSWFGSLLLRYSFDTGSILVRYLFDLSKNDWGDMQEDLLR